MPGFFSKEIKDLFSVDLYRACAAEFIGVLLLTFMAMGTGITSPGDPVAASIEAGFFIGCAIRILSTVSGGHVNPAISVGFLVLGQITVIRFIFYSIIQTLGSAAGAALLKAIVPANQTTNDLGIIFPASGVNDAQAIVCEMIITFFLLFGTFAMIDPKRIDVNGFAPFQIGLIVVINIFATVCTIISRISFYFICFFNFKQNSKHNLYSCINRQNNLRYIRNDNFNRSNGSICLKLKKNQRQSRNLTSSRVSHTVCSYLHTLLVIITGARAFQIYFLRRSDKI